jgi:hypothetical protein
MQYRGRVIKSIRICDEMSIRLWRHRRTGTSGMGSRGIVAANYWWRSCVRNQIKQTGYLGWRMSHVFQTLIWLCLTVHKFIQNVINCAFHNFGIELKNYAKMGNCVVLGHYEASSGNFLQTFRDNISVQSSRVQDTDSRPLKMGLIGWPETSVINYHYTLRNDPEESSYLLLRGGSLKSNEVHKDRFLPRLCQFIVCNHTVLSNSAVQRLVFLNRIWEVQASNLIPDHRWHFSGLSQLLQSNFHIIYIN